MNPAQARAALIDLDGTLLDTAPDLYAAANATLAELGYAPVPLASVRDFVGKGVAVLMQRCLKASLGREPEAAALASAQTRMLVHYEEHNGRAARVYPGVVEGLRAMRAAGLRLACGTNKPMRFTQPLLERTGLRDYFDAVSTSDLAGARKPDPAVYLHACRQLGVAPAEAWVIGDSDNDGDAARAAGCRFLLVTYGYREGAPLESMARDASADSLTDAARQVTAAARSP